MYILLDLSGGRYSPWWYPGEPGKLVSIFPCRRKKPGWRQNQDKVRQPRVGESAVPRHHLDTLIQLPLKQETSDFFQFAKLTHFFYFCLNWFDLSFCHQKPKKKKKKTDPQNISHIKSYPYLWVHFKGHLFPKAFQASKEGLPLFTSKSPCALYFS